MPINGETWIRFLAMIGKNILMVHKHFVPDTPPYANMLYDIAEHLSKQHNKVTVFTAQPSYKLKYRKCRKEQELSNGVNVKRVKLLSAFFKVPKLNIIDMIYFPLRVAIHILMNKYDVVSVSTAPQVTLGFFAAISCKLKKTKLVYHCMDIHPEIGRISGEFSNPIVYKALMHMDNYTLRQASKVIVLSKDMHRSLELRGYGKTSNIKIINNFSLTIKEGDFFREKETVSYFKKHDDIRIIFAGNVGRFQGLDNLVKAFNSFSENTKMELVFLGEGSYLRTLKKLASHSKIKFFPHLPVGEAKSIIKNADFGVVSLQKEVFNYAYPSKTLTYLEQGLPILALIERESELSTSLISVGVGVSIENDDITGIKELLIKISRQPDRERKVMSAAASQYYKNNFDKEISLRSWSELLEEI